MDCASAVPLVRAHLSALMTSAAGGRDAIDGRRAWEAVEDAAREACREEGDRAVMAAILLEREEGLFAFVVESLMKQGKATAAIQKEVLKYIAELLEGLGPTQGTIHAELVTEQCLRIFKSAELDSVKSATLEPVLVVLGWPLGQAALRSIDTGKMAVTYQRAYQTNRKLSATIKGDILRVLGILFEISPNEFHEGHQFSRSWLRDECTRVLSVSGSEKLVEALASGAMSALASALSTEQDSQDTASINAAYHHVKGTLNPVSVQKQTRYNGVKSGMRLLGMCATRFGWALVQDAHQLVDWLAKLRSHHNHGVRDAANQAINALFQQVSAELIDPHSPGEESVRKEVLQQLLGTLTAIAVDPKATNKEITIAIQGMGWLAKPCSYFFGEKGVRGLLAHLSPLLESDHLMNTTEDLHDAPIESNVSLLSALGRMINCLAVVEQSDVEHCQQLTLRIIVTYLDLWPKQRAQVHGALACVLTALRPHPIVFESLLQHFIENALTCTMRPHSDGIVSGPLSVVSVEEVARTAWTHYEHLWLALLRSDDLPEDTKRDMTQQLGEDGVAAIQTCIYDYLMRSLLTAIRALDLGYHVEIDGGTSDSASGSGLSARSARESDESEVLAAEMGKGLVPDNVVDMHAFINLADFFCSLMQKCGPKEFEPWAYAATVQLISEANRHQLLSGFYRMIAVVMKLCKAQGLFAPEPPGGFAMGSGERGSEAYTRNLCIAVYREYLQEVLVACRRYTDDLLCASLELLLSCPSTLLPPSQLGTPIRLALRLGLQFPRVASVAVDALENWETHDLENLRVVMPVVLPLLEPYLRESGLKDGTGGAVQPVKRKGSNRLEKRALADSMKEDFETTQERIQLWLGRQGKGVQGLATGMLEATPGDGNRPAQLKWDPDDKIGIHVAFPGLAQASVAWLDMLVPQAAVLAETSSQRATRVAGCEFLHAVTLWMVGTNARRPYGRDDEDFRPLPTKFHRILRRLFPVLLRLAVVPEPVARQLFEPLVMSLIHWFTRSARREAAEMTCLIDAIMEGLGNEGSGALRELCARAAAEFLKWSAKHVPLEEKGNGGKHTHASNLNAASLLRRLFDRLCHPDPYQRLGAASAVGLCARVLRGESDLMDSYLLQTLYYCVKCLRLADGDAPGSGTPKQASHAISAMVHHCLPQCGSQLSVEKSSRVGFTSLDGFLEWLWEQTIVHERACRRSCMLLHERLTREMAGRNAGTPAQWWSHRLQARGRASVNELRGFIHLPVTFPVGLADDSATVTGNSMREWLRALEAALEWTRWALEQEIIAVTDLQCSTSSSHVMMQLAVFLSIIPDVCSQAPECWGYTAGSLAGCEAEAVEVSMAALELYEKLELKDLPLAWRSQGLLKLLLAAIFMSGVLGVGPAEGSLRRQLAKTGSAVLKKLALGGVDVTDFRQGVTSLLQTAIGGDGSRHSQGDAGAWLERLGPVAAADVMQGVRMILDIKIPGSQFVVSKSLASRLPQQCMELVMSTIEKRNITQLERQAAEGCLSLALHWGLPVQEFISLLLEDPKGESLHSRHEPVVQRWLLFNSDDCVPRLVSALCSPAPARRHSAERMLLGLLGSLQRGRSQSAWLDPLQGTFLRALLRNLEVTGPDLVQKMRAAESGGESGGPAMLLRLLKALVGLDPSLVLRADQPGLDFLVDTFIVMLDARSRSSSSLHIQALQLLPAFLTLAERHVQKVTACLQRLVTDLFPVNSSKMVRGSIEAREYEIRLGMIMKSMVAAMQNGYPNAAVKILEILLPVVQELGEPSGHLFQLKVKIQLGYLAAAPWGTQPPGGSRLPASADSPNPPLEPKPSPQNAGILVSYCLDAVFNKLEYSTTLRKAICRYVLIPCLELADTSFTKDFFAEHVVRILNVVEDGSGLGIGNETASLCGRLCGYLLLEAMYCTLGKDVLDEVVLVNVPKKNQKVMKLGVKHAKEFMTDLPDLAGLCREVCAAAFATVSALLISTQRNPKFFTLALQGATKGAAPVQLWTALLDPYATISFSVDSMEGPGEHLSRTASIVTALKDQLLAGKKMVGEGSGLHTLDVAQSTLSAKIAPSQYSLVEDGEDGPKDKQDVTDSVAKNPPPKAEGPVDTSMEIWGSGSLNMSGSQSEFEVLGRKLMHVEDQLDANNAMLALVLLLERGSSLSCADPQDLPIWQVLASLKSPVVSRYAKLFLCKAIVHVELRDRERSQRLAQMASLDSLPTSGDPNSGGDPMEVDGEDGDSADAPERSSSAFSKHAHEFFPPMVDIIVDASAGDGSNPGEFNSFVRSVCFVFLRWALLFEKTAAGRLRFGDEIEEASVKLLGQLGRVGFSNRADVLRINSGYIQMFVGQWGAAIPFPVEPILTQLTQTPLHGSNVNDRRHVYGLSLLCYALKYGHAEQMLSSPQAEDLWKAVLRILSSPKIGSRMARHAGEAAGQILHHLSKNGQRLAQTRLALTQVESEVKEALRPMYGRGQYAHLMFCLERMAPLYPMIVNATKTWIMDTIMKVDGQLKQVALQILRSRSQDLPDLFRDLASDSLFDPLMHSKFSTVQQEYLQLLRDLLPSATPEFAGTVTGKLAEVFVRHSDSGCRRALFELLRDAWRLWKPETQGPLMGPLAALLGDTDKDIRKDVVDFWHSELPQSLPDRLLACLRLARNVGVQWSNPVQRNWPQSAAALLLRLPSTTVAYDQPVFETSLAECKFMDYSIVTWQPDTLRSGSLFSFGWGSQSQGSPGSAGYDQPEGAGGRIGQGFGGQVKATMTATLTPTLALSAALGSAASSSSQGLPGSQQELQREHVTVQHRLYKKSGREAAIGANLRRKEAERRRAERRRTKIQLYRSYRAGELPDIQGVKMSGFVGPLALMAERETGAATLAVVMAARVVVEEIVAKHVDVQVAKDVQDALEQSFATSPSHAGYVQCLAAVATAFRGCWVDPFMLCETARASGEHCVIAFMLEQQILHCRAPKLGGATDGPRSGKQQLPTHPIAPDLAADNDAWKYLADLYQELNETELLHVIRMDHLTRCPGTKTALRALHAGRTQTALNIYQDLMDACDVMQSTADLDDQQGSLLGGEHASEAETDIWYDDSNLCMERLGKWQELRNQVKEELQDTDSAPIEPDYHRLLSPSPADRHLRRYLRPFIRGCLFEPEHSLLEGIIAPLESDPIRFALLESSAPMELACYQARCGQWDLCRLEVAAGLRCFRQQWSATNPLSVRPRSTLLGVLQPLSEIHEVTSLLKAGDGEAADLTGPPLDALRALAAKWSNRMSCGEEAGADVGFTVLNVREVLLSAVQPLVERAGGQEGGRLMQDLSATLKLSAASLLQAQGLLDVADKVLEGHRVQLAATPNADPLPSALARTQLRLRQIAAMPDDDATYRLLNSDSQILAKSMQNIRSVRGNAEESDAWIEGLEMRSRAYMVLAGQPGLEGEVRAKLRSVAVGSWNRELPPVAEWAQGSQKAARASLGFAQLCMRLLEGEEGGEECAGESISTKDLSAEVQGSLAAAGGPGSLMTRHLMAAVAAGGEAGIQARLHFPHILSVMRTSEGASREFGEAWRHVPLASFLPWAPQMLAHVEAPCGPSVVDCLAALSQRFPQQVYFPFQLSRRHFKAEGHRRTQRLQEILDIPLLKGFANALDKLTYPVQRWAGHEAVIARELRLGNRKEAVRVYNEVAFPDLFGESTEPMGCTRAAQSNVNVKFAHEARPKFLAAFGASGAALASMDASSFQRASRDLLKTHKEALRAQRGQVELMRFTDWFSKFSNSPGMSNRERLLLPGTPAIEGGEGTVAVVGFGQTVDVFMSKQRPKKLLVYGDDFGAHVFLVKGGEELRTDQRVEQLFAVMNGLLDRHPPSASRGLRIRTYDVIPMSPSLGLVAFVPGTRPLESVLDGPISHTAYRYALERYQHFVEGLGGPVGVLGKGSRQQISDNFNKCQALVPWDGLREALLRYAGSGEVFLRRRELYIRSLVVNCILGYIAGVGDRHLQNFLLEEETGQLVPIDFGYSFGTATQVLHVPELMPFRLTRQLLGVMLPHKGHSILRGPMRDAMEAVHSGRQIVQGVVGAFLQEPLLDWQKESHALAQARGELQMAGDVLGHEEGHAQLKVDTVKWKLNRHHPSWVTLRELQARHSHRPHWGHLQAIVTGDASVNARAKLTHGQLASLEEQVDCLLDQATDVNILGRSYMGWRPWI